ncbi:16S rRNA (cytidine(1402)-2'-O)-methyltransferase [Cyanobium sp. ATX 6A2]|nr:16S rRNA (cytidine(1402)-2'-O)-methyltransferase [Cyanobium sp. ATX 6A2]
MPEGNTRAAEGAGAIGNRLGPALCRSPVSQLHEPAPGVLYLVGTPIGNLGDLSPRARQVLAGVDRIACEDTRRSGLLLHQLGLRGPAREPGHGQQPGQAGPRRPKLLSFHQHNQASRIPELLAALDAGEAVAVISDAGLPGISDPGEALVAAARQAGLQVICVPGPSAVTTALVSSGLPCGRFCFEGFLPAKASQRRARLQELATEERTLVLFEAPHRLLELLEDLLAVLGDRPLRVARELTKRHEQQVGPTVSAALEHFRRVPPLGECTLVLGGAPPAQPPAWDGEALRAELERLVAGGLSSRDAARQLAEHSGHSRRALYALLHHSNQPDTP